MPAFYDYQFAIFGADSSDESGAAIDYTSYPTGTWSYTGGTTSFMVREQNPNDPDFDGDKPDDQVAKPNQIGRGNAQTTEINGTTTQLLWDYTFQIIDPDTLETWEIGVVDVDLDNNNNVNDPTEAGYYLIFIDGVPPPDTVYNIVGVTADETTIAHTDLGGVVVCFAAGTMIDTPDGKCAVETLEAGDLVITRDAGAQPLRWVGQTVMPGIGKAAPVVIPQGALGNDAELVVSPQHAVLIETWQAELLYGTSGVLVRSIDLVGYKGIHRRKGGFLSYHHILFDKHQLVMASGIWSESLYPGDMTFETIRPKAREEIKKIVPDIEKYGPKAAPCLRKFEAACLAA